MPNRGPRTGILEGFTALEVATLIAVVRLDRSGYGLAIHEDIESFLGKPVSTAAVYAALHRLKGQRLIRATISAPLAIQGGRSKRLYELTMSGCVYLETEQIEATRLWQALPRHWARRPYPRP